MAPLAVDPEALSAAGSSVAALGGHVAAALGPLTAGFSANTGQDAAGEVFGLAYQDTAEALLNAAAAGINALRRNGAKIQLSASNYSVAEATSTVGGGADVLAAPAEPQQFVPPGPPATLGPGVVAPVLWAVVQSLVGDLWPNGDAAGIRAAAGHWRGFAATLNGVRDALNAPKAVVAAQDIPEGSLIKQVLSAIGTDLASVGEQCGKLATALENFANEVANTQDAIRDLLDRLGSVSGLWDQVVSFLEGHLLDEVHEIAEDIQAVLHNMGRQAKAREQQMQLAIQILDGVVVGMQRHVRGQLTRFLGEEVGNPLATVFDTYTNTQEGFVKAAVGTVQGLEQLDPQRLLTDPEGAAASWKAMTKTGLLNHILNPQDAAQADRDMAKGLLHLEDWRRDRPGLGLGGNLFDVASVAIPGVGGAGAGASGAAGAARGAEAADAAAAAGRGGRVLGEAGELTGVGGAVDDIGQAGHGLSRDLKDLSGELPINDPPSGGRPVGLPAEKSPQVPVEPTPRPVESVPLDKPAPESPTTSPGSGVPGRAEQPRALHEPTPVPAAPSHPTSTPTPAGEHLPPTGPHVVKPAPASPGGSLVYSEPAPGHWAPVPAPAESKAPAPQFTSPASHPTQLAPPHGGDGGAHGLSDGSPPDGGGLRGSGDGRPGPEPPGNGFPHENSPAGDGSATSDVPDSTEGVLELLSPTKLSGVDYSLPAGDALGLLENPGAELARLADGGVPPSVLDGYQPLAGRTVEDFEREFTIQHSGGERRWDWDTQAPENGFAGKPLEDNRIPADFRLDRLGSNAGGYLSPEGTPLAERATPPGLAAQYHVFVGTGVPVPPGKDWVVMHGPAKDAFGQPGGGDQWVVLDAGTGRPVPVEELIKKRLLREMDPSK